MAVVHPAVFVYLAKIASGGVPPATSAPRHAVARAVPGDAAIARMLAGAGSEAHTEVGRMAVRVIGSYTSRSLFSGITAFGAAPRPSQVAAEVAITAKIKALAAEISRQPGSGSDGANLLVAEREVLTRERAAEIGVISGSGPGVENWLKAEFEVVTAQRARALAKAGRSGGDLDNWLAGETEARIVLRAEQIARNYPNNRALDNWLAAKGDLGLA